MIKTLLAPHADRAHALLRIVAGFAFSIHGMQKLFGVLGGQTPTNPQIWAGAVIELVCGLAVMIGLFTPAAAFLASGTMAVAYIQFHWKFAFDAAFFPPVNKGELALLYAFVFLAIACRGAGPWSVDARRASRSSKS
jgi:putative oxidoreductase